MIYFKKKNQIKKKLINIIECLKINLLNILNSGNIL